MDTPQSKKAYYKVEVIKDATVGRTMTPGIPPGVDGKVDIWSVQDTLFSVRVLIWPQLFIYRPLYDMLPNGTVFIRSNLVHTYGLAEATASKDIEITAQPFSMGKSSFNIEVTMKSAESGKVLVRQVLTYIAVDRTTRKSTPLPDKFRNVLLAHHPHLTRNGDSSDKTERAPTLNDTDLVFRKDFVIGHEDIDHNNHTNVNVYHKLCHQLFKAACEDGTCFSKKTKESRCEVVGQAYSYLGESFLGDTLVGELWETKAGTLWMNILRDEKKILECSCQLEVIPAGRL